MIENIIIADDSATARLIVKRCLEIAGLSGANFLEAADGVEALNLAKEQPVDLLVTDLNMPNMDGRALLKRVKASPKLHDLPVIVISSASNEAIAKVLIAEGALTVVNKPISPGDVVQALGNLTDQNQWG